MNDCNMEQRNSGERLRSVGYNIRVMFHNFSFRENNIGYVLMYGCVHPQKGRILGAGEKTTVKGTRHGGCHSFPRASCAQVRQDALNQFGRHTVFGRVAGLPT